MLLQGSGHLQRSVVLYFIFLPTDGGFGACLLVKRQSSTLLSCSYYPLPLPLPLQAVSDDSHASMAEDKARRSQVQYLLSVL